VEEEAKEKPSVEQMASTAKEIIHYNLYKLKKFDRDLK
jgi:hypothetical protein